MEAVAKSKQHKGVFRLNSYLPTMRRVSDCSTPALSTCTEPDVVLVSQTACTGSGLDTDNPRDLMDPRNTRFAH